MRTTVVLQTQSGKIQHCGGTVFHRGLYEFSLILLHLDLLCLLHTPLNVKWQWSFYIRNFHALQQTQSTIPSKKWPNSSVLEPDHLVKHCLMEVPPQPTTVTFDQPPAHTLQQTQIHYVQSVSVKPSRCKCQSDVFPAFNTSSSLTTLPMVPLYFPCSREALLTANYYTTSLPAPRFTPLNKSPCPHSLVSR